LEDDYIEEKLKRGWWYSYVYRNGVISSYGDMLAARKRVRHHFETDDYEIFTQEIRSWGRSNYSDISEGRFTKEELKQNYGRLMRTYKNGFKKQV